MFLEGQVSHDLDRMRHEILYESPCSHQEIALHLNLEIFLCRAFEDVADIVDGELSVASFLISTELLASCVRQCRGKGLRLVGSLKAIELYSSILLIP